MTAPLDAETVALLLMYEQCVPLTMSLREALQKAFNAGRMRGRIEGIETAQKIIKEPIK